MTIFKKRVIKNLPNDFKKMGKKINTQIRLSTNKIYDRITNHVEKI